MKLIATCVLSIGALFAVDAFGAINRPTSNRLSVANNLAPVTNENPSTVQDHMKNSVSKMLRSASVVGAASLALSQVVFADDAAVAVTPDAEGYITTESGLKYRDTKVGEGATPLPGDTVRVHYTGWLDGLESEKKFDSSYDRRSPLSFKVGTRQVIAGWDEALLTNLKVGGKRDIIIPPALGYGKRGAGGVIPPDATLYFKIELVGLGAR